MFLYCTHGRLHLHSAHFVKSVWEKREGGKKRWELQGGRKGKKGGTEREKGQKGEFIEMEGKMKK